MERRREERRREKRRKDRLEWMEEGGEGRERGMRRYEIILRSREK